MTTTHDDLMRLADIHRKASVEAVINLRSDTDNPTREALSTALAAVFKRAEDAEENHRSAECQLSELLDDALRMNSKVAELEGEVERLKDGWRQSVQCYVETVGQRDSLQARMNALEGQKPVAYGMGDTMIGCGNRLMMVRLDKGQDGCNVPLYLAPGAAPKAATIANAPNVLNTNDKAMWVLGFNAAQAAVEVGPTLKWCEQCGEGVTDFCRGKGDKCEYGFERPGSQKGATQ